MKIKLEDILLMQNIVNYYIHTLNLDELNLVNILNKLKVKTLTYTQIDAWGDYKINNRAYRAFGYSGEMKNHKVIIINDTNAGYKTRMQFTVAHELGHIFMKHTEKNSKRNEFIADLFAIYLLLEIEDRKCGKTIYK